MKTTSMKKTSHVSLIAIAVVFGLCSHCSLKPGGAVLQTPLIRPLMTQPLPMPTADPALRDCGGSRAGFEEIPIAIGLERWIGDTMVHL